MTSTNRTSISSLFLVLLALLVYNCGPAAEEATKEAGQEPVGVDAVTGTEPDTISLEESILYTTNWQDSICSEEGIFSANKLFAFEIPIEDFEAISQENGVASVRAYMGYNDSPRSGEEHFKLILVGIDSTGKDMIGGSNKLYDFTTPCPDLCDNTSQLYHGGCSK